MNIEYYSTAGFFSTATISAIHFQDFILAFMLGFVGAFGGYLFKLLKDNVLDPKK